MGYWILFEMSLKWDAAQKPRLCTGGLPSARGVGGPAGRCPDMPEGMGPEKIK